jgi:hypothetical protein
MSQIETEIVKQGTPSRKVLSCSFFTMHDAYRNVARYEKNLVKFLKQKNQLKGFETRIYTDKTGLETVLKVATDPDVTVIKFNCAEFREGNGHVGTFGTLVRFLPLFEDLDTVWVTDIDIPDRYLAPSSLVPDADIQLGTYLCYNRKVYGRKYTILAGKLISRVRFSKSLLTNFIHKVHSGDFNETIKELNNANIRKPSSKFPYGMDEVFMNTSFYDSIRRHDLRCQVTKIFNVLNLLKYNTPITKDEEEIILDGYLRPSYKNVKKVKDTYLKLIPYALEKYPCLQDFIDNKDKMNNFLELYLWVDGKDM